MLKRVLKILILILIIIIPFKLINGQDTTSYMTNWSISPSLKYDALCFLNIMTAESFYLTYYNNEYDKFKDKLTDNVKLALADLKKNVKDEHGNIISASLCLYFSAVEDSTLEQMLSRLDNLDELKKNFSKTPYYDEEGWKLFESTTADLKIILSFLISINFEDYWKSEILPLVQQKIAEIEHQLPKYDVIKEDETLLGFKLPSNTITIYLLYYSQPHGIKITGTRFLTDIAWPFKIVLKNAVHEMMHPPYEIVNNLELRKEIKSLSNDEFLMDKVKNHNPSFGYNTLEGLIEEDCVQTMEQLINEKFGVATDAKKRWKESDDGIHVFAVALYQIMKEENYNEKREVFSDFLIRMIKSGKLGAGNIKTLYDNFYK